MLAARYPHVLVEGEIRQIKASPAGHVFLTLSDRDASLSGVAWRNTWRGIRYRPREGEKVIVRGRLSIYPQRGTFQIYVNDIRPAGAGDLAREIEERKQRLESEGLLDPRRKRELPAFPRHVGVATSLSGAALQDFLRVSGERFPASRILVAGCTVQGPTAPPEILRAVELLIEDGRAEVIVVTRGGGSREDLLAFQDEALARFLAHCPVPVVSAVGHEVDTTIADLVADVCVPTPTAAAVRVLPDGPALARRVTDAEQRLGRGAERMLARRRDQVVGLEERLRHPAERLREVRGAAERGRDRLDALMHRRLQAAAERLGRATATLEQRGSTLVLERRRRLEAVEGRLRALSPQAVLDRGYAVVTGPQGLVRRASDVQAGQALRIQVSDGVVEAEVRGD